MMEANIFSGVFLGIPPLCQNLLQYIQREHSNPIGRDVSLRYTILGRRLLIFWEATKNVIACCSVGIRLIMSLPHELVRGGPVFINPLARLS